MTYGETDEVGHKAAVNVVTPNDYQATILNQLGFDHNKLAYLNNGRELIIDIRPDRFAAVSCQQSMQGRRRYRVVEESD